MKQYKKYFTVLLASAMLLTSCDKDFEETNTNPVIVTALDAQIVMNNAILLSVYADNFQTLGMLTYNFPIVQQVLTPFGSSL